MIHSVTVTNYLNQSLELELRRPDKTGLLIANITGLGPGTADILMTDLVTQDGSLYNMSRLPPRQINMSIKNMYTHDMTEEDTRQLTYKYFPIKQEVQLKFVTDNRRAIIRGRVETNEPVIFSNQVHTQLTITCPDPYFYSEQTMSTTFEGVTAMFEFPWSNESLTENLIIMGEMFPETTRSIFYQGDGPVGVTLHIFITDSVTNLRILDSDTGNEMSINHDRLVALTGHGLIRNDHVVISTVRGNKSITLYRGAERINILNALNRDAYWFQLRKGDNIFEYSAEFGLANIIFRIENQIAYEGL